MPKYINSYIRKNYDEYIKIGRIFTTSTYDLYQFPNQERTRYGFSEAISNPLIGYLMAVPDFSEDTDKDNYYRQIFILWAKDRLEGFNDNSNYILDYDTDEYIEVSKDQSYEEKFLDGYYEYENVLSTGDKEMLKLLKQGKNIKIFR